jgi:hypothetical protein
MPRGPLPLHTHAAMEPVAALVLIASPWLFGFDNASDAKTIAIVLGVVGLLSGMATRWRMSVVKLIPLRMHFMTDLLLGALLIAAPFLFGFSDDGGATRFFVIAGALELLTALTTDWDERQEVAPSTGAATAR